jgi:hypothetical protein
MTSLSFAAAGRWLEWAGLDPGLGDADVMDAFAVAKNEVESGPERLGRRTRPTRTSSTAGEPRLRWWLGDTDHVLLLEMVDPPCHPSLPQVMAELGRPEREGAGRHRVLGGSTTEHVWTGRGLSLTTVESYDDPPSWPPRLAAALLFEPTDLGLFVRELGGDDRGGPSL